MQNKKPRQYAYLQCCTLTVNEKKDRYIIAVQNDQEDPLVIYEKLNLKMRMTGIVTGFTLYFHGLTKEQAKEILSSMKKKNPEKAESLFLKYFNRSDPYLNAIQQNRYFLEDIIPDDWYDSWKEMESTTVRYDAPAYFERNVRVSDERG